MSIHAKVVVPSDTATLDQPGEIYVGSSGDIACVTDGGDSVTFVGVVGGTILPVIIKQVLATNTTASNMLVNY